MKACIDVGSNTILLLVGNYDGKWVEQKTYSTITALGKNIDQTRVFSPESIEASYEAFKNYAKIIEGYDINPKDVIVTATEASRVVTNSEEFFKGISNDFGFTVSIISSEGEAFYTAFGVMSGLDVTRNPEERLAIIDIGGASTELIQIKAQPQFEYIQSISLPVGSVRGTDWLNKGEFDSKMAEILNLPDLSSYKTNHIICVAGSMTAIAGMLKKLVYYSDDFVHGSVFDFNDLSNLFNQVELLKIGQLASLFPFLGKRSETIRAGLKIGTDIGRFLGVNTFEISTFGLRHGVMAAGKIEEKYVVRRIR